MEDANPIGHFFGNANLMGAEKDGHALCRPLPEDVFDDSRMMGVEAHHGFINDEDLWVVQQGAGDGDSLPCAVAEGFNGLVQPVFQIESGYQFVAARADLFIRQLEQSASEPQKLRGCEFLVEKGEVGDVAQAGSGFQRIFLDIEPSDPGPTCCGANESDHHLDGGGFPGRVGAQDGKELAAWDFQADPIDGSQGSEVFGQAFQFDHEWDPWLGANDGIIDQLQAVRQLNLQQLPRTTDEGGGLELSGQSGR